MKRARIAELRTRALRANRLRKNITGDELAARLKVPPEQAYALARIGGAIALVEAKRLSEREYDVLRAIVRVIVRNIVLDAGANAKTADVDHAAGKRSGWCRKTLLKLATAGLAEMPGDRIVLTNAGWALAWEAKLILPNWKVSP